MKQTAETQVNYRLYKKVYEQTPICKTYDILNQQTNARWRSKVFNLSKISQYGMQQVIQYNEQILQFIKLKYDNTIHCQCIFERQAKQYVVFQMWDERMSTYLRQKHPNGNQNKQEVKKIMQQVLMSICDIYAENYMILNLRPENLVRISSPSKESLGWRIESFVFDYTQYNMPQKCEYEFDYSWASNQQKQQKQHLDDEAKDEQIVWYTGILALRIIYGQNFKLNPKFNNSDLNLPELKQKCHPAVFELITRTVKANRLDRIGLKELLSLSIFSQIVIQKSIKEKIIMGNFLRIGKSTILKNSVMKKSSIRKSAIKITASHFSSGQTTINNLKPRQSQINEHEAQLMFNELRWNLQKCLYFAEIKYYTQSNACYEQISKEDKILIRYIYFKIAEMNFSLFKKQIQQSPAYAQFRESACSKQFYKELIQVMHQNQKSDEKCIVGQLEKYGKKMQYLDPLNLSLLKKYQHIANQCKKGLDQVKFNAQKMVQYFSEIAGKFYSCLKRNLDDQKLKYLQKNRSIKKRSLCYFALSSYILIIRPTKSSNNKNTLCQLVSSDFETYKKEFSDVENLKRSLHVKFADEVEYIRLCEYNLIGKQDSLINNSQMLLTKYFITKSQQDRWAKQNQFKQDESKRRPSIGTNIPQPKSNYLMVL